MKGKAKIRVFNGLGEWGEKWRTHDRKFSVHRATLRPIIEMGGTRGVDTKANEAEEDIFMAKLTSLLDIQGKQL